MPLYRTTIPFDHDPRYKYKQTQQIIYKNNAYKITYTWNTIAQTYSARISSFNNKQLVFNMQLVPYSPLMIARDPITSEPLFGLTILASSLGSLTGYLVWRSEE